MKVLTVIGARPTFIKSAGISKHLKEYGIEEKLIHTGHHYDENMSDIFFNDFNMNGKCRYMLNVSRENRMLRLSQTITEIKKIIEMDSPDYVIVFGDTDSAISGAVACCKMEIPLIHIEAGMRSFEMMPEEMNRIVIDHMSEILFCPTIESMENLSNERIESNVYLVGDVMYDMFLQFKDKIVDNILNKLEVEKRKYILVTVHREINTSPDNDNLKQIVEGLLMLCIGRCPIVFPMHPRTMEAIENIGLDKLFRMTKDFFVINPVGYNDMLSLEKNAKVIITDSGGVQKESAFFGVPCIVLRNVTEWDNLVKSGHVDLVGVNPNAISERASYAFKRKDQLESKAIGDGMAGAKIAEIISRSEL